MVSFFVVFEHPCPGDFTHFIEVSEQPSAQYLASIGAIEALDKLARNNEVTKRLQQLRGVGPIVATALVATVGNGEQYSNGRQMAAPLGLTPRQNSSGDKRRLLGISKRGDVYMRTQLIHGARSAVSRAKHRDNPLSRWATDIAKRRHPNVAAVALANKTARMA